MHAVSVRYALLAALVVGPTGVLVACADDSTNPGSSPSDARPGPDEPDADPTEPRSPYEVSDYTYTLRRDCFCVDGGIPVSITVRDGTVVEAVYARKGHGHPAGAPADRWLRLTIDDVVEEARSARAEGAHVVSVRWPAGQDHPSSVSIDQDVNALDDEVSYHISNVSPG